MFCSNATDMACKPVPEGEFYFNAISRRSSGILFNPADRQHICSDAIATDRTYMTKGTCLFDEIFPDPIERLSPSKACLPLFVRNEDLDRKAIMCLRVELIDSAKLIVPFLQQS